MDRWTSSSQPNRLADLELACKAATDRLLLANQLHAERAQEFEAKHSTLQERCKTAAALAEQHRLAHARQGEVTRAVQARLDELQAKHTTLLSSHQDLLLKQAPLQAKHDALQAAYQDILLKHGPLQAKHDALQAAYEDILLKHGPLQAKHDALLGAQQDLKAKLDGQLLLQTRHSTLQGQYQDLFLKHTAAAAAHTQLSQAHQVLQAAHQALQGKYADTCAFAKGLQDNHHALERKHQSLARDLTTLADGQGAAAALRNQDLARMHELHARLSKQLEEKTTALEAKEAEGARLAEVEQRLAKAERSLPLVDRQAFHDSLKEASAALVRAKDQDSLAAVKEGVRDANARLLRMQWSLLRDA